MRFAAKIVNSSIIKDKIAIFSSFTLYNSQNAWFIRFHYAGNLLSSRMCIFINSGDTSYHSVLYLIKVKNLTAYNKDIKRKDIY